MSTAAPQSPPTCPLTPPPDADGGKRRQRLLLRVVLLVFAGQLLICFCVNLLFGKGAGFLAMLGSGFHDFKYFHAATRAWLSGGDPYTVFGFVTPPLSLLVPVFVARLPVERANLVFRCCNLLVLATALWCYAAALRLRLPERTLFLLSAALFLPAWDSVRGGNMDGLMLALLIVAFSVRRPLAGALALAASITVKLYSIVFLPVALRRRQWRFAALTVALVLLLLVPFARFLPSFLHAVLARGARFNYLSVSPALVTFVLFGAYSPAGRGLCLAFWAISLGVALWRDRERGFTPHTLARYAPWMLGLPYLVFSYCGVLALPLLASLLATAGQRRLRPLEICSLIGFLLLGAQLVWAADLLPVPMDLYHSAALLQSVGVILMMIGSCTSNPAAQPAPLAQA